MANFVHVHFLPSLVEPAALAGGVIVVLDILRASTTIVTALVNGAKCVLPTGSVDEALATAKLFSVGEVLLGGERGGVLIPGFNLGNSPAEYSREVVNNKTIVFTTTNGTAAMLRCKQAAEVLIGSFVNLEAVCNELAISQPPRPIHLLCAGSDGEISREDVLCAGAIVDQLFGAVGSCENHELNDEALLARDGWQLATHGEHELPKILRDTLGGRNLSELGMQADIDLAAALDRFEIVPKLDLKNWRITF